MRIVLLRVKRVRDRVFIFVIIIIIIITFGVRDRITAHLNIHYH